MRNVIAPKSAHFWQVTSLLVLCGLSLWLYFSNLKSAYRRGLAENPVRLKIGMRPIEPAWKCFRSINGKDEWLSNPNDTTAAKVVKHGKNGTPLWETDSYANGRTFTTVDGEHAEEIKLHCDYSSGQLSLAYLGDDKEIRAWVEEAGTNNPACLTVIAQVRAKWFGDSAKNRGE